jgi:hypothetical protein
MAQNRLQSLVQSVAATATDNATGLVRKSSAMRFSAFLSYPRHLSPSYQAEPDTRPGLGDAVTGGMPMAMARAGRPGCWAGVPCLTLARNPRGTIHSRWSRPLAKPTTKRRGLRQPRITSRYIGIAVQG